MGWWMVIYWIAMLALAATALRQPKQPTPKPASLQDFDVPKAEDGALTPVLFGTKDINGPNVVWYGHLKTVPLKSKGGKK